MSADPLDLAEQLFGPMPTRRPPILQPTVWLKVEGRAISFTIRGQAMSKANSRQLVFRNVTDETGKRERKPMFIKSAEALQFERDALLQIPQTARQRLEGPVCVTLRMFYATERPDLDESLVLDVLQDQYASRERSRGDGTDKRERYLVQSGVYRNDRQVREKHVYHAIDKANPRVEICVEPMQAQQVPLL
jgi:Holliday junction resolvase RusA-like endonuclease